MTTISSNGKKKCSNSDKIRVNNIFGRSTQMQRSNITLPYLENIMDISLDEDNKEVVQSLYCWNEENEHTVFLSVQTHLDKNERDRNNPDANSDVNQQDECKSNNNGNTNAPSSETRRQVESIPMTDDNNYDDNMKTSDLRKHTKGQQNKDTGVVQDETLQMEQHDNNTGWNQRKQLNVPLLRQPDEDEDNGEVKIEKLSRRRKKKSSSTTRQVTLTKM